MSTKERKIRTPHTKTEKLDRQFGVASTKLVRAIRGGNPEHIASAEKKQIKAQIDLSEERKDASMTSRSYDPRKSTQK